MKEQQALVTRSLDPKSPVVEAYRTLRTNLQFTDVGGTLSSVLITSPGPGEGKSTISANLAVMLARSGQRVIVAGADLRKPALHRYYGLSNGPGITNILTGQAALDKCLVETGEENLLLLPSGPVPPNPAELLGSARMKELLGELRERADMVLVDASPVVAVTDAAVLAPLLDGVLLIINVGTVPRELAKQSKEQLEKVGARLLGVVLNRVSARNGYGYYYYYYTQDQTGA